MSTRKQTLVSIQADFDRIALIDDGPSDQHVHYHEFLTNQIPDKCRLALEIGCGTGMFSRTLASRAERVMALDLSPQMILQARQRSREYSNIEFVVGDVMDHPFPDNEFDCVATITTLHHLPMKQMLRKIKRTLKPGGTFICLDLYQRSTVADWLFDAIAYPTNALLCLVKTGRLVESKEIRDAYAEHGKTDVYLTLKQVKEMCAEVLPGAHVRRHLFWRYSIVWKKESRQ